MAGPAVSLVVGMQNRHALVVKIRLKGRAHSGEDEAPDTAEHGDLDAGNGRRGLRVFTEENLSYPDSSTRRPESPEWVLCLADDPRRSF